MRRRPAPRRRQRGRTAQRLSLITLGGVGLVALSGTAFTAQLSGVPQTSADRSVSAYPSFSAGSPSYADVGGTTSVTFTVTPQAGQVRARVLTASEPARPWQDCVADPAGWRCAVPGLDVSQASAGTFQWAATP